MIARAPTPLVIRPAQPQDLPAVMDLLAHRGPGLTSLPRDATTMRHRLVESWDRFTGVAPAADAHKLLLLLEDPLSDRIAGITGCAPRIGSTRPTWHFRLDETPTATSSLGVVRRRPILVTTDECTGSSEVGSLMLHPDWRGGGNGRLLARCRYLFIAAHRSWFADTTLAQMRGYCDEHGRSPLWDAVGSRCYPLTFAEADHLSGIGRDDWVPRLMPRHPIAVDLLPEAARSVLGRVHPETEPALHLLEREGFASTRCIDLFDGGPVLACATDRIATIAESGAHRLHAVAPGPAAEPALIAVGHGPAFRCAMLPAVVGADVAAVAPEHLQLLGVGDGAQALIAPAQRRAAAA